MDDLYIESREIPINTEQGEMDDDEMKVIQ